MRRIFVGLGPTAVLLLAVACGFVYWCVGTQAGTRWVFLTAAEQLDGKAEGIQGSIWNGVQIRTLQVKVPGVNMAAENLQVQVNWGDFLDHSLHIRMLSADKLDLDLIRSPPKSPNGPFKMPGLPVGVELDRFALGELAIRQDGKALPLTVRDVVASLSLSELGAQLSLHHIGLGRDSMKVDADGEVKLLKLKDPWPVQANLVIHARDLPPDSLLCARHFVPTLPEGDKENASIEACVVDLTAKAEGSLDALKVVLAANGQGLQLDGDVNLAPRAAFPLRDAVVDLGLMDGSSLHAKLGWQQETVGNAVQDHVQGTVSTQKLNVGLLAGPTIPSSLLTSTIKFDAQLRNRSDLLAASLDVAFGPGSRWNKQPLSGTIKTKIVNTALPPDASATSAVNAEAWKFLQVQELAMDVRLGKNRMRADGSLGRVDGHMKLDVQAPELAAFWPDAVGGLALQGEINGWWAKHSTDLKIVYSPPGQGKPAGQPAKRGGGAAGRQVQLHMATTGAWGPSKTGLDSWQGKITQFQLAQSGASVGIQGPIAVSMSPGAVAPDWEWQVGAASLDFRLPSKAGFVMQHKGSRGRAGIWETQGGIGQLTLSPQLIRELRQTFNVTDKAKADRGGVNVKSKRAGQIKDLVLAADWHFKFAGTLGGQATIKRISGDLVVPGDPPYALGLQDLILDLKAGKAGAAASRLNVDLKMNTARRGQITASGSTLLRTTPQGQLNYDSKEPLNLAVRADIADIAWLSRFIGDNTDLGGSLHADVQAKRAANGSWATTGVINGKNIKFVRLDDGVRLFEGTLEAHLANERLILDKLSFPARLRVDPKEWRTNEWVHTSPDAKNGHLTLSGDWDLLHSAGVVNIDLYRYPILQRSDRYAMISGKLKIDAQIPKISIVGDIKADAGWFDLDMLSSVPTLDSDVVVLRPGVEVAPSTPMAISMDLKVDLGPRFYITGFGLDSGLIGSMRIIMADGKLTGEGALRTRGGAISAYGQHLQLRRGTITFQGDIANPVLNIEALRTGVAVEAGVRVAGTGKRPRIDLVSYPNVSDVEKLSWLLLGRAPDEGGGDAALLLSVGTSLIGGGAPFYRKLGLDEVSIQSGELASTGSLLPVQTVVNDISNSSNNSTLEQQFVRASKILSKGITVSVEQALSKTGTVGRLSYLLAKGLTAELSVGTVSGIALVYRTFFKD
ncbi:translocation/assembly module TamB domain-containing protein [Paralcaligenes sp. KSB-10]|uniref:translocation/assembly module TamB domain-containing protein n=1 Tax=Paralcaligenes sp. KSB-10 TaxID=2901142 RepID=UPI001E39ED31|nr:translocation/assembly module TamB domain-containing protein [Paralcaligenes sp. KSB-10]UHL64114.1 translocation/assembly module TamB domain-containing protein [Paralcaligenes sp. KSB-10]